MLIDSQNIWHLYLEGAAEDMMNNILRKNNVPQELHDLFLSKENNKLVFKTDDVPLLYKWIQNENADARTLKDDYTNYQKFFGNTPLTNFTSYLDFTEKVHAKRDEAEYLNRNKNVGNIELEGSDKENIIENNDEILILKGDDEHKCVKYGKGYSFCISRGGGGNMYGNYRLSKASTFYFVFFKNIPKEDERHIMVLDRTDRGWEWTFGKNQTEVVQGGWDEIVAQFPILAKYKDKFVNKPLTPEEEEYQKRLQHFSYDPTLEEFNNFSYKEKADVLKFGMSIPKDLFESLDKYLRNEWISVGPKMSDEIYYLINHKEKERFVSVRLQQMSQKKFDEFDNIDNILLNEYPSIFNEYALPKLEEIKDFYDNNIDSRQYIDSYFYDRNITGYDYIKSNLSSMFIDYFIKNKILMPFLYERMEFDSELENEILSIASKDVKFGMLFMYMVFDNYAKTGDAYPLPLEISKNIINEKDPIKYIAYIYNIFVSSGYSEHNLDNIAYRTLFKHLIKILPSIETEEIKEGYSTSSVLLGILISIVDYKMEPESLLLSFFNAIPDKFKKILINKLYNKYSTGSVYTAIKKRLGLESPKTQENLNDSVIYNLMKSFLLKS